MSEIKEISTYTISGWSKPEPIGADAQHVHVAMSDGTKKPLSDIVGNLSESSKTIGEVADEIEGKLDATEAANTYVASKGGSVDATVISSAPDTAKYPLTGAIDDVTLAVNVNDTVKDIAGKYNAFRNRTAVALSNISVASVEGTTLILS